ncbi:Plant cysteine oxidase 3 [Cardamine amara subsp. amara]|uniref:cysteine dioxygenase n=1 Tax=Cardamine amara subsp. amara TaxID=228776 RepID=A0ABD0ZRS5_CARAN
MLSRLFKASEKVLLNLVNKKDVHMASRNKENSPKVQELYDLCKETFTGKAPSPASIAVQKFCSLLDSVSPADVGLEEEVQDDDRGYGVSGVGRFNRVGRWAQPITFLDIHECDTFTMCIFCFPTSSVIPLHDHPEMTVFSKVLYGSLHVKAYDWVEPPCIITQDKAMPGYLPAARLAKLVSDKVITPQSELPVLYPKTGGNLHCFTALTPCAVLDILTPPYRESVGRTCSYYMDYPFSTFALEEGMKKVEGKEDEYAWLVQIDTPDDLHMRPGSYTGPTIKV